jgi:hypothetical protein
MSVKNRLLRQFSSRLGNKAAYRCYLLEPFRPADIYATMISSMCWELSCGDVAKSCTWSTTVVPHFHSLACMPIHTISSSGSAEVRWKRGGQLARSGEHGVVGHTVFAGNRCSTLKFYLSLRGGAIQDSTYIHRVTEPAAEGCRSTTVVPVLVYV